jgi:uncharacterized membrane protein
MKAYLFTTGSVFGLLTVVHIWRMVVEPSSRNPWLVVITLLSTALCGWGFGLFKASRRTP